MKNVILLFITLVLVSSIVCGQNSNLYIPINVQKAIDNGTRSLSGLPGENYWQNKSEYKITAEVLPDSSYLIGKEVITYHNNSPVKLKELVIRLYQDIAKPGAVRDWYVGKDNFSNGVKINYLVLDGDTLDVSEKSSDIRRGSTNMFLKLTDPVLPNTSVKLEIGWEFEIPTKLKIRMGNYGNGNLYVAYWYPQMAVYDDIDGWDKIDYSGMVEFYNDFSDYDVTIKTPKGMVVWATGDLQNGREVLREDIFAKYQSAQNSDETIRIINQEDYAKGLVTASNEINEWKFIANSVSDFTFATSTNFNWDGASVVVDRLKGKRTLTDVVYKDSTIHYDKGSQYARATIEYLSHEIPGYPYPYSHTTTYCNGNSSGGMESPMMANNGAPSSLANHVGLLFHEIAHNYFPFIMGNNERKYAWMDEGWAAFLPTEIVQKYDPEYEYRKKRVASYVRGAGMESDLPLVIPSYSYKTRGLRLGFYDRPANAYYELQELLGDELFKIGMFEYMERWNGKHPLPHDFFLTFNDVAEEDLTWFWKPWFYEFGYPDLAISNLRKKNNLASVQVNKVGNIPTRVEVTFEFLDGTSQTVKKKASVWSNSIDEINIKLETNKSIKKVSLGSEIIPDVNNKNNIIE